MAGLAALAAGAAGAALGALGPEVLARLPEPHLAASESAEQTARHPPKQPYAVLARTPGLRAVLSLVAGVACAALGVALGASVALPAYVVAGVVGTWLGYVDLRLHLLPDRLGSPLLAGCGALLALAAWATGDWSALLRAVLGAAAMSGAFLLLALLRPSDLGFGDVKLARVLGLLLGWLGWDVLVVGTVLGFLLGGLTGLLLLATRRVGLRTALPFGPFMLGGALGGVLLGPALAAAYLGTL